ncbi:TetR family transcriptional regulator [Nocardia seriolae]|uniref:TetR/AcrR family transcriptional regulator n=1 Tax=Nocardia seriolae TaxID=37332 RepID=UPI0012BBD68B|nr:TetR/AcrR family transcriptional regulator [Nocardia seriolae]MTL13559.1 TetR family transcriptional regulator [Nocardia seriolae]
MVTDSKRRIVGAAAGLLARHGYHGFGLKKLSEAAGLPYGSIYHHFPGGKEEIAVSAITGTGVLVGRIIGQAPGDVFGTAAKLFDFMATKLAETDWTAGCPVGTPALDGGSDVEAVRAACVSAFEAMAHGFAEMLTELGLEPEQARDLATTVVAAYEGATILARVRRTDEPLHTVSTAMARLIRLSLAEAAAVEANSP